MIKKIVSLTYNELIKQLKKTSVRVIISLMLILAILIPIGMNLIDTNDIYDNSNKFILENAKANVEELKKDKTEAGKIHLAIAKIEEEVSKLIVENEADSIDWKSKELENYRENSMNIFAIKEILNGINKDLLLTNIYNVNPTEIEEYFNLSKEELNKKLEKTTKENEEIKNIVINNEYLKHLSKEIKVKEQIIEERDKNLKELEKSLEKDGKNEELKNELIRGKKDKVLFKKLLEISKYRYENKINFEKDNWKNKTLMDIEKLYQELNMDMLTEKEYQRQASMDSSTINYSKYQEMFKQNQKEMEEKINRNWYSLENNLPQLEFIKDARSVINGTYEVFIILIVLVIIIISGGIVSSEFSKGTIRLLLIRPVSRWKILLSKLLATLIIGYGMLIVSISVLIITSGIIFGFDTLQIPVVQTVASKVVDISYIQYILPKILISSTSLVFIISLAFMISTLIKNTALAVSISTIVYLGAMPSIIMLSIVNISWIGNTLIPYINQSMFNLAPSFIETLKVQNGIIMNPTFGGIQLLIVSLIMLIITFFIFTKKDIKN
ncbi:ABC transporter permease subunit [Clostridium tarantellae]|uniref:ABC transporter permease subunit n=1 Tax=Clostridium tarantellae TaxID=39493 RepID=A0A6I1MNB6_9CLOT|nr:ABC transporter permease subunit [Clostridium tarantellae]MPQ43607.1 ABC transporter permease subunit [Clostridium tarantellae]